MTIAAAFLALTLAPAAEVKADPVACRCRVGPVRCFLRRVFRPCPPPPCPPVVRPATVIVPVPPPAATLVPPATPPVPSAANPFPPATGSSLRKDGILTPPQPPPAVRLDRIG